MMTKHEIIAAVQQGATIIYARASMGSKASASVNGQHSIRADIALKVINELDMRPDKPYGLVRTYRLGNII
jgi:hypothetical protein